MNVYYLAIRSHLYDSYVRDTFKLYLLRLCYRPDDLRRFYFLLLWSSLRLFGLGPTKHWVLAAHFVGVIIDRLVFSKVHVLSDEVHSPSAQSEGTTY